MRTIATPEFSQKALSLSLGELTALYHEIQEIEKNSAADVKHKLSSIASNSEDPIFLWRKENIIIFLSFGSDSSGEYALLVDLSFLKQDSSKGSFSFRNDLNIENDPRQNVMIDPRRNMMIDPLRNMMIDPRRNMMIDPRRNMMIDPRRNMMIDPQRNWALNPKRNYLINPLQNAGWNGPILYSEVGVFKGFLVRANEKIALLFGGQADFEGFCVAAEKNLNQFLPDGSWTGFFVENGREGYNQFDTSGRWIGFTTKPIL